MPDFFQAGTLLLPVAGIAWIDTTRIDQLEVEVGWRDGRSPTRLEGLDAINLLMQVKPSALEGRRLRWVRHAWAWHNFLGHPGVQLLAWAGAPRLGIRLHEATVPRPKERGQP